MLFTLKDVDEVPRDVSGLRTVATVEAYLSAAGLVLREGDVNAKVPKHLHRCFTHLGKELVNQARRAEGRPYPWLPSLLVPSTGSLSCHAATVAEARLRGNGGSRR